MRPNLPRAAAARIAPLDSLRGIAALAVVLHHLWLLGVMVPATPWQWRLLRYTPLDIVVEGRQPVILFFVLSGFVLAHALIETPTPNPIFLARRFIRIYLPFAAAITLSAGCYALLDPPDPRPFSPWFGGLWQDGNGFGGLTGHLLMRGTGRDDLDPVVWSLVHELRISVLLPLLLWACRRRLALVLAASLGVQWLVLPFCLDAVTGEPCRLWLTCRPFWGGGVAGSLLVSAYFVCFFVLGIAMALKRQALRRLLGSRTSKVVAGLAALGLLANLPGTGDLGFGFGAALLIALALEWHGLGAALRRAPLLWLGRVSYSLYLVHVPVFLLCIYGIGSGPAVIACLPLYALLAAALFYALVERPAQRLGLALTTHAFPGAASARARA